MTSMVRPDGTLMLVQLRVDPAHARAAGYRIEFLSLSERCDICAGSIDHRVGRRPLPFAIRGKTLLYYPSEWAFCDECFRVRHDEDALAERLPEPRDFGVPEHLREIVLAQAVHALFAWRHSGRPYRPRREALRQLAEFAVIAEGAKVPDGTTVGIIDARGMPGSGEEVGR